MAKLFFPEQKLTILPKNHHKIGRSSGTVDTTIKIPEVSRLHCILNYVGQHWSIRDVSTNGVWVNGEMMPLKSATEIKVGDEIVLSGIESTKFIVLDEAPPVDYLTNKSGEVIQLEDYNILPNNSRPELAFYYDSTVGSWLCQYFNEDVTEDVIYTVGENEGIRFSDCFWQLHQCRVTKEEPTAPIDHSRFEYIFQVSQDEEEVSLELHTGQTQLTIPPQAHNYLTMLLARYKLQQLTDRSESSKNLGWVSTMQLQRDLGLTESHLNIQVHRARKQFATLNIENIRASELIERKRGRLRFSGDRFIIYKGGELEGSSLQYMQ